MAVVNNYMTEEQKRINNQKARNGVSGYNYSPVSAEKKAQTPQVTQPAAQYTAGKTPGTYVSRYQPVLDSIMDQIQNPEKFKYEFNGDELFKNYADLYTQYGKQASLDAMGQAAGLTGGYGNSYGQQAGQQAYQQYLLSLYDKGLNLRNTAYQGYQDELANLKDAYSAMQAAENADYSRYADALSAWQTQQQLDLDREKWEWQIAQLAAEEAGGGGGGRGGRPKQTTTTDQQTGTTFQDATNAVQTNILKNNQNLPASTLNSKLTGTVADYVKAAQNKLASMPATLQAAITGSKTTNNKTLSKTTPAVSKNKFGK